MISRFGLALACASLFAGCGGSGDDAADAPQAAAAPVRMAAATERASAAAPVAPGSIRMHFHRMQGDEAQWGVYSWDGPQTPSPAWISGRFMFTQRDAFGAYVDIPLAAGKTAISFLVTDGNGTKNCGADQQAALRPDVMTAGQEVWLLEGDCTVHAEQPALTYGNLGSAKAHWLSGTTLAWPGAPANATYRLYYALNGGMTASPSATTGLAGADGSLPLEAAALPEAIRQKFPHLAGATGLRLAGAGGGDAARFDSARLASAQFAIAQIAADGSLVQVTSLQQAGMLDDLFATRASNAQLGVTFDRQGVPTFRVWAPTAKSVRLDVYASASAANATSVPMTRNAASGVWSYTAPNASWTNSAYYTYTVQVLSRWANNTLVTNTVTDPYSLSVSANSTRSFVANLDSPGLKPAGWDDHAIPKLDSPTDIALYELHIRDFSATDNTVPAAHRGKYLAFTDTEAAPMRHLKSLQKAGMTHVHLLPSYDFSSVDEAGCVTPVIPGGAADATTQQAAVAATRDTDCFNWGYDPVHYNTPEGSYATDAKDGAVRVREFRSMVQALHETGLRVTMDVVYNHTSQSQQGPLSVLDRIVPAYYYRLGAEGNILNDSCCADTAQENAMMAKLMIDSVALWTKQYKIDSFRFDIMGFTPLALMKRLQVAADTAAGRPIYLYGEAWNFGAVGNDARFVQARQANMFGTGIGSFNDRIRDTVRGGGCCDTGSALVTQQGFINGVWLDPNAESTQTRDDALRLADLARVALSGTLRDYRFTDRFGNVRSNAEIDYFGQQAGFAASPAETINYIEAHDNQTLFDVNALKLPQATPLADRVRVQTLGAAINILSQGVPFFHAGQEILRSKSLDRDSYNAGDWFNRLDYGYTSNNFGVGLPVAGVNEGSWPVMAPVLANPLIAPDTRAILAAKAGFEELLAIRQDSTLFRLRTAQDVIDRLKFHNTGPNQVPGVVAMSISGTEPTKYPGAQYKQVVVVINVGKAASAVAIPELKGRRLQLHRIQRTGSDAVVKASAYAPDTGSFTIPARTTAVFVQHAND
ncbi:alpha-1,6-glucosidase domain-containing protein [Pseudoduganella lutea]|uniref:alpha-1,6-glucosidase domain-containing protein n=1 Tax=Pseudoduganella lutea TaxID=321985 RepID=UPI001E414E93|nr:alpha-1,6-glucosidase domain-containing protein [Pseudoduganella lutea]